MAIQIEEDGIKQNLVELIIRILSRESSLRIKEIHTRLKDKFLIKTSFQAVRKSLNQLVEQGKLIYNDKEYSLNKAWVKNIKQLSDKSMETYFSSEINKPPKVEKIGAKLQVFHFDNALHADRFVGELLWEFGDLPDTKILCIQALHFWYPLGHLGTENEFITRMQEKGNTLYYLSFGEEYLLDELAGQFYHQHGVHYTNTKDELNRNMELLAVGDFIIRVEYSDEFIEALDKVFRETKKIQDWNLKALGDAIKTDYPVTITVFRDPMIAKSIQEKTVGYYK